MKRKLLSLIMFILFYGIPLANAGSYTANNYFWKPAYRESGPAAYSSYNAALDATDLFLASLEPLPDLIANWVIEDQIVTMIPVTATYGDNNTFTVPGDYTSRFPAGAVVQIQVAAGMVFSTVASSSYAAPTTTVNLADTVLTNPITRVYVVATRDGLWPNGPGWVVARDYGTDRAALEAADAVAAAAGRELRITHAFTIDTDVTLTAPKVTVQPGVPFAISTTKTLTISGALNAGLYRVFACTGTGKVVLAAGAVKEIHPEWWVANATPGTTDMTTAILAAYTAAKDAGRGKVKLLANQYAVADLIFPTNATPWLEGILIEGSGQGTKIVPAATHTAGNFLMTFQGIGEVAGVGQSGTGWITLSDFYIDGGSADLKGILIQPSNNFRLRDITFLSILGTALEAERPYDLYCTRLRFVSCGSFADSEAAVRMIANPIGTTTSLSWGNQVYWTDCNIEAYQYRGLELIGCSTFAGRGGKVHGSLKTVTTSLGNVYIDGGGEIRFTDFNFVHPHREPALYIKDEPVTGTPAYYSQVALSQCTFSQCESYDAGYDLKVLHYAAKYNSSQLAINGCTFNITSGGNLGTNGRLIYIDPAAVLWRINIGANLYNTNTRATILEDGRNSYLAPDAPTYVGATSFTLPGDYSSGADGIPAVSAGQTLSAVLSGGSTVYSTVVSAVYAAPNTTVTVADGVFTDPAITSVTFYDRYRHTGAIAPEVHALALTLGHDTSGGQVVTLANDILDIRNTASAVIAVGTEAAAASDDMARIVGGRVGSVMVLRVSLQAKPVTVKHGTGNIWLKSKGDCILNSNKEAIVLFNYDGANWVQIGGTTGALPVYANNAAAIAGGLTAGDMYRTNADPDPVCIVH